MSHSAFRILASEETVNRHLVIVVNKNGQVSTDTEALQNLLTSKGDANTEISILRETSPTPSITEEINQERNERYEMKRQEYLSVHAGEDIDEEELEIQMRQITGSMEDEIPHVTLNVENFYTPDQARKFANDVLHLGGIDNPSSLMPIDFNFRRQVIQNDHCYTPLTQSPEQSDKSQIKTSKGAQNKSVKREPRPTPKARQLDEEDSNDSDEAPLDDDEEYEEEQSGEEEEMSFSESDDDNDIDFSVNDRFGKKGKKKRKYRKHMKQKNMTFKDFLETGDVSQVDNEPKKKYNKSPKKATMARPSTSGKNNIATTSKNTQPNILVKKAAPQPLPTFKNHTFRKESTTQFVPLTVNYMKTQPGGQISIQTTQMKTASVPCTIPSQPMKSKQEIEFVASIVKDLEKSFPENKKPVPNIMEMMEMNTPVEVIDQTLEELDSADGGVPGIEEINDVLAVLGNEAIDELLNQNDLINFDTSTPLKLITPSVQQSHASVVMSEASSSLLMTPHMPKILNKQAPSKDQIKVVRNGRVITLPPIEAPATRGAKRRAQGDSPNTSISSPTTGKVAKTEKTPSNKDPDSTNSSRRSSLAKSESGKSSRRQSLAPSIVAADEELEDLESEDTGASEDDPDRLWCICRQPHNNRFMICCDKCEEWFHGKCVNVTKAMGAEFEQKKKEWRCPNCRAEGPGAVKKIDPKKKPLNQQKLTKFFAKSQKESTDEDIAMTVCVVCKQKVARDSSIYCSDECIQNHATKHLDDNSSQLKTPVSTSKGETGKRGNVLKDKMGNVIVYDKTNGKILPLSKSPHFTTLGQWLSKNPNFEPVKPGSAHAEQILSRNRLQSQTSVTSTTSPAKPVISAPGEDLFSNPVKINTGAAALPVAVKKPLVQGQHSGNSVRSNVSMKNTSSSSGVRPVHKSPGISSTSSKASASKPEIKRPLKSQQSDERSSSGKLSTDRERAKIRDILKETLQQRMKEFNHPSIPKMSEEEIEAFAKETEKEMFYYYSKNINEKYKAKYRSLKFNLSDVKNKTLMERICTQNLTPKQLVELPSAALASEELSKWREHENKHQLEIITKSELDALAQTKIVVKTHKGEEIIEQKSGTTDILVPAIDDVESAIAKSVLSVDDPHGRYDLSRSISLNISGGHASSPLSSPSISSSTGRKSDPRHRSRSRSKSRGKDHHHHHKSSSSKHKKSERHRSRSPRHHKDRKSRERSKSKKSEDHKHHRDKSKSREKEKSGSSSRSRDHRSKETKKRDDEKPVRTLVDIQPDQQDVDLVGKILDSMGVHLDKPSVPKEEKPKEEVKPVIITVVKELPAIKQKELIEVYSGKIFMADVAEFEVTASIVSGNFDGIVSALPAHLDIVGRIEDQTVLDYLEKVTSLPGKELCMLRFSATPESKARHDEFFNYLHSRQRYGVIRSPSPRMKDFYLITIKAGQPLPAVLSKALLVSDPGFVEGDDRRPDLLIGAILKIAPDRTKKQPVVIKKSQSKSRQGTENSNKLLSSKHKSQTSKLTMGLPEFSKTGELQTSSMNKSPADKKDDGDEPYTPFDDEELSAAANYKASSSSTGPKQAEDLESEMEKINREIEQRQMEIQSLAKQKLHELDEEEASRIFETINVPHNLSEMLSTISKNQTNEIKSMEIDDDDDEYVPIPMANTMEYRSAAGYSAINQQQQPVANSMMDIDERIAMFHSPPHQTMPVDEQPSRLASMTAADLMKLVPDGAFEPPPAPIISEHKQPSIPGLGNDDYDIE